MKNSRIIEGRGDTPSLKGVSHPLPSFLMFCQRGKSPVFPSFPFCCFLLRFLRNKRRYCYAPAIRRWLIEKGGGLAIVKKPERQPATAIPANSANSDNRYQDESSKSSGNSSSNGSQLFFAPATPELNPALVVDVDASIRNLLAQFEASNATEMRARANG